MLINFSDKTIRQFLNIVFRIFANVFRCAVFFQLLDFSIGIFTGIPDLADTRRVTHN